MGDNFGRFRKGHVPWNKGKPIYGKKCLVCGSFISQNHPCKNLDKNGNHINPTSFKKGHKPLFPGWKILSFKHRENISKALKGKKNPAHSKRMKKLWQKQKYIDKQCKAKDIKPNKSEQKLNDLLQTIFPNEYKYVGDFSFLLGGRCPDFINVNGQKKLIELYGDYFHNPIEFPDRQLPQERIAHFEKYGFKTLIVWEKELKNEAILIEKLKAFQGGLKSETI